MKHITYCYLITGLMMSFVGYAQVDNFAVDIKLSKDTLYPFDMLEFEVIYKVLTPKKAYPFENGSYLQIKMVEPEPSEWFMFSGPIVSQFGNPNDIEGEPIKKLTFPLNHVTVNPIWIEYVPTLKFTNNDVICLGAFRPGKYILRVAYSPDELIGYYHNRLESCESCIIDTALVIVTDRYPEKDQAAFDWLVRDKHYCNLQKRNYESYHLEEFIKTGEEFLHLFPESSFVPYVHCKIGESILKIYEKNAEESKLPPAEAAQKLEAIVTHLSFCKLLKKDEMLSMYYAGMYKKYKDNLLRFKVRHGIK